MYDFLVQSGIDILEEKFNSGSEIALPHWCGL